MVTSGHLLDNRYRLDERIATGGMGDVWRGTDVVLGRVIAVKVLRAAMLADPEFAARFYGEARMMAAFRHPGVVEVYDYAGAADTTDADQCAYLVMAYVDGEPLATRLKNAGRLGVSETMSIVAQAADALHAAHQSGIVHRDVKPGNLIVKPNGTVILVDFGVARSNAVTSVTGLNAIVGTALYMAPEQVAKGNVSPATDIYALGAVAHHCIAGHPPFEGDSALQVALRHLEEEPPPLPDDVPDSVRQLVSRAMAKHPDDRFASAAEFADAALEASAGLPDGSSAAVTMAVPGGLSSTRTAIVRAPANRAVPIPPAVPLGAPVRGRTSRSQVVVLMTILALLAVAGGVALTIGLSSDSRTQSPVPPPEAPVSSSTPAAQPSRTPSVTVTRATVRPKVTVPRRTPSPRVTGSTVPSADVTTTAPPTTVPTTATTTTPPPDETKRPTVEPTTEPTTPPTTTTAPEPTDEAEQS